MSFATVGGVVHTLDSQTGSTVWEFIADDAYYSSPAVSEEILYLTNENGYLYALDHAMGSELWRLQIGGVEDGMASSPMLADGLLYVGSSDGNLYAIE